MHNMGLPLYLLAPELKQEMNTAKLTDENCHCVYFVYTNCYIQNNPSLYISADFFISSVL